MLFNRTIPERMVNKVGFLDKINRMIIPLQERYNPEFDYTDGTPLVTFTDMEILRILVSVAREIDSINHYLEGDGIHDNHQE